MKRNAKICLSTDTQKHLNGPRVHKESRREFCLIKTDNSHMTTYTENNTLALLYRLAELSYFEKKKKKNRPRSEQGLETIVPKEISLDAIVAVVFNAVVVVDD